MARVLVVGASGMLGHQVCQQLLRRSHEVVGVTRRPEPALARLLPELAVRTGVDVLDEGSLERVVRETRSEFIINAVGLVKQSSSASDKFLSTAINAWLPHRLSRLCRQAGARLLHVSTDCVFDGSRGRYTEEDPSDAKDLYGKSKWMGELDPEDPTAVTFRTSIIGRELKLPGHGLIEWFLAQSGKPIKGFARAIYTGLTTIEISRVLALAIEKQPRLHGLYHVASEPITKFELLTLVKKYSGVPVNIQRDEDFFCDRSLIMKPFRAATDYTPPSWPAMVEEMCKDFPVYDRIHRER